MNYTKQQIKERAKGNKLFLVVNTDLDMFELPISLNQLLYMKEVSRIEFELELLRNNKLMIYIK